jgi:hypothetical protein
VSGGGTSAAAYVTSAPSIGSRAPPKQRWFQELASEWFLDLLDDAEQENAAPVDPADQDWGAVDPLTAQPGQVVDGGAWRMERQLGVGGTARAIELAPS